METSESLQHMCATICVCHRCACGNITNGYITHNVIVEKFIPAAWTAASLHSSGFRLCNRDLEPGCGDLLSLGNKSISEVHHWCWTISSGSQLSFRFFLKVLDGVAVRALCRSVSCYTELVKPFLYGLSCSTRKRHSCWQKVGRKLLTLTITLTCMLSEANPWKTAPG